jgi:glycine oxidase
MTQSQNIMKHISIIGAGVAGLWCGLLARKKGFNVTIYEQDNKNLTQSCSYRAGGMLAFNCEADSKNDSITVYGKKSLLLWQKNFPDLIMQKGSLLLAPNNDKDQLRYFEKVTSNFKKLTPHDITTLEPDLEKRFDHGLFYQNEAYLEPRLCIEKLLEQCFALGVEIKFNHYIDKSNKKDITIDTTGLWGKKNLYNLRGVKGEMIVVKCPDIRFMRPIRLLHPHHPIYIVPRPNNHYMIGATTIESENSTVTHNISVQSAGILLTQAFHVHPAFGEAEIIEMNVGYRPAFDNNKPQIITKEGIYYLNGLYRHGWTVAPALAEELIEKVFSEHIDQRL